MPAAGTAKSEAPSASYYDAIYAKSPWYACPWRESAYATVWEEIARALEVHAIDSVLELGCGPGQLASCLRELRPAMQYRGLDFSPQAIEMARKARPDAEFAVADLREAQAYEGDYQAVVATEVFEHLDDDRACVRMIPTGKLVIFSVPNFDDPGHVRYFSSNDDVLDWYEDEFTQLRATWMARNERFGYWVSVGRR